MSVDAKFLESRNLKDAVPTADWSIDDLGAAAAAELALLVTDEQSVTVRYWRLGRLLNLARKPLTHGQWGVFLKQWKIDKTRSAKALRIFKGFATAEATAGLTVAEAYARTVKSKRRLKSRNKSKPASVANTKTQSPADQSWSQFALSLAEGVERRLEETERLTTEEAAAALESVGRLLATLHECEERLRRRSRNEPVA